MTLAASDILAAATALADEWGLPLVARDGDCMRVSEHLVEHLGGETVTVWGWVDAHAQLLGFVHVAVQVGSVIVDATATQFDAGLPMPWVCSIDDYCIRLAEVTATKAVTITPQPEGSTTQR